MCGITGWVAFGQDLRAQGAVVADMVATMACLQQAQRVAGDASGGLIAAMTAAFAVGQAVGPLTVTAAAPLREAIARPSAVAAALLLVAGIALLWCEGRTARK